MSHIGQAIATAAVLATGVFLLLNGHGTAGGWCIAIGLLCALLMF